MLAFRLTAKALRPKTLSSALPVAKTYGEKISGVRANRPELLKLLKEFLAHNEVDANLPDPWATDSWPVSV